MEGHLFVIHGDLTRLDVDGVVIPCDEAGNIDEVWRHFLREEDHEPGPWGLRLRDVHLDDGLHGSVGVVDDQHVQVVATAAEHRALEADELVTRVAEAVRRCSQELRTHGRRHVPLLALPLVGTGAGGHGHERGTVVHLLVPVLARIATECGVDVALVLHDRRDYAAVQGARHQLEVQGASLWGGLSSNQRSHADALGGMAGAGELSLFVGSGVGVPLGLPNWNQLLQGMAQAVRPGYVVPAGADLLDEAAGFRWLMGDDYEPYMEGLFDVDRHALGHALLAALHVHRMVTTNYDPCLELALDGVHEQSYEVLTRSLASGGRPWLLKLHGDIRSPGTLVLTRAEYDRLAEEGAALHGVVESLMLTSHVLFVGFSLVDHDFSHVADGVRRVRDRAVDQSRRRAAGTALTLHPGAVDARAWQGEIDVVSLGSDDTVPEAARTLEIFLDRLAWAALSEGELAGEYLLDERYVSGSSDADRALRDALAPVVAALGTEAVHSAGWVKVERLLLSLGLEPGAVGEGLRSSPATPSPRGRGPSSTQSSLPVVSSDARDLALEVARCPLIPIASNEATHPCHDVVTVQDGPEEERQVPEAWAGALESARVLFVSSNPSISEPEDLDLPESAESYPRAADSDAEIVDFVTRRFDPSVLPFPHVTDNHHRRIDGSYAPATKFWSAMRARARELLGPDAEPFRDYAMTEVVHCKSKHEVGVKKAAATCADSYLDRVLSLSPAEVVVIVGSQAHDRLADLLELSKGTYVLDRRLGGRDRLVVYLPAPSSFGGPKTFEGLYPADLPRIRDRARGVQSPTSGRIPDIRPRRPRTHRRPEPGHQPG